MSQENVEIVQRLFEASDRATEGYSRNPRSIADSMRAGELDPEAEELIRKRRRRGAQRFSAVLRGLPTRYPIPCRHRVGAVSRSGGGRLGQDWGEAAA
jgi:hypothetical protein